MEAGTQWLSNVCLKYRPCKDFFLDCCDHRWWGRIARWCGESRNGPIIAARSNDGGSDSLPPRSPQMRTFFEQVSSLSSQSFSRCWGTPASKIPICCQYLNQCQHPLQQNLNWLKYVSVRVYVLLLLFISKEWNFVPVVIFVGNFFFCWKSFTGLGMSGHPFPGQDACACASLI